MTDGALIVWDDALLGYDLGEHPLDPVRLELTMALARAYGVLDRPGVTVTASEPADLDTLRAVHTDEYIETVRAAPADPYSQWGHGLGTPDNPIFPDMHEASALVAGATVAAAEAVWTGRTRHAVNIAGGLHHAMPDRASGFCVYNDPAIAIKRTLALGAERIAYVDVDVHHGDGVQAVFYNDPRVLTISIHESPATLFPGVSGFADEIGGPGAPNSAINIPLPFAAGDDVWHRAFDAAVPDALRRFRPQVLFSQCGADAHALDPLANLRLTVDGQRESYLKMRALAEELCDGRWVVTGGGGYALVEAVPRAWTHLLAIVTGEPIDPARPIPGEWRELARARRPRRIPAETMSDR
jgi:acetoin utilization protein AcuC